MCRVLSVNGTPPSVMSSEKLKKDQATESVELSNFCLRDFRAQSRAQAVGHEANEPCDDGSARVTCAAPPMCRDETRPIKPYQRELRTNR